MSHSAVRNKRYAMNGDDEEFINAKAWNFRARDGTDDWAEMINNAQKQHRIRDDGEEEKEAKTCLLYTSPSPRDRQKSRMPSSA